MTDITLRYLLLGEDKSASSAVGKIGGAFSKLGDQIGGEFGEILNKVGEGIDNVAEHSHSIGKAAMAVGGVVAGIGVALQAAGSKDKAAMNQLNLAIKNAGQSAADYKERIEEAVKANENYGISAADTTNALATLTTATGSPTKALQYIGLAANLAAARHISLAEAAASVAKVLNGSGSKVLKQYGIVVDSTKTAASKLTAAEKARQTAIEGVTKAQRRLSDLEEIDKGKKKLSVTATIGLRNASDNLKSAQDKLKAATDNLARAQVANKKATDESAGAIDKLQQKVSGQAAASVDTFSGRIQVAKTKLGDWVAEMGQRFGPAITYGGTALATLATIYESDLVPVMAKAIARAAVWTASLVANTAATVAHTVAVIATSVASGAAAVATDLWTVAQWALNAAFVANPIGLIILGIAALVAITIEAYRHSATFRAIVQGAFHAVLTAATATFGWIKGHWPLLLAILTGPFGIAVLTVIRNWGRITALFHSLPKALQIAMRGVGAIIVAPFTYAFGVILSGIHDIESAFNAVKSVLGGGGPSLSSLHQVTPHGRAKGGPVRAGMPYIVGENHPELFVPDQSGRIVPNLAGGGTTNVFNIEVGAQADPAAAGRTIIGLLQKAQQANGGRPIPINVAGARVVTT